MSPGQLPRWFWLLPVAALCAWWPLAPWWQSDDFFAVHYVQDARNVLHDFVGPQYGATDVWAFYRPLITASFWLDQQLGGPLPPLSHVSNVLAHAASTLLLACIWRRFLAPSLAALAALLWAVLPSHQGSLAWAVGRVDSHTTVWCLLAVLLVLRAQERRAAGGRARAWPLAAATAAALGSKELALVLPALVTFAAAVRATGPWPARVRAALALAAPAWLVFAAYLPLRFLALGRFGGYEASAYEPLAMLAGLVRGLADLGVPLRWSGLPAGGSVDPRVWLLAAATPVVAGVLLGALRAPKLALAAALAFLLALLPMASFLPAADNPQTQRLWYLPAAALCGMVAAGGRGVVVAALLALVWPFVAMRTAQHAADRDSAAMHRALLREAADGPAEPMFVAGLPHTNPGGTVVQLRFGVDRLLQPPFCARPTRLYALRPLDPSPAAFRLFADGEPPFALPRGSTWFFAEASALGRVTAAPPLPDLPLLGDEQGVVDLTTPRLDALVPEDAPPHQLRTPGVRPMAFRVTLFTASGYLAAVSLDHAAAGAADGAIDFRKWFAAPLAPDDPRQGPARFARAPAAFIGEALPVPTTVDLSPVFPALVEAGALTADLQFVPTHRARRLLDFRFDRDYPQWKRRVQGR